MAAPDVVPPGTKPVFVVMLVERTQLTDRTPGSAVLAVGRVGVLRFRLFRVIAAVTAQVPALDLGLVV